MTAEEIFLSPQAYNPLSEENIGAGIFEALCKNPQIPLSDIQSFDGSGVYCIYYAGDHPAYGDSDNRSLELSFRRPIYVGKASSKGARIGFVSPAAGKSLNKRLKEHAASISATDLKLEHFFVRYICLADLWIDIAETAAITRTNPVWNVVLDGFGNHNPGRGRLNGARPKWDTLHPGRKWAENLPSRQESADQLMDAIRKHLSN